MGRKKQRKKTGLDILKGIRKPMPPPTRVINPKKRQEKFNWRDHLEGDKDE
jgi:hypothetical protein